MLMSQMKENQVCKITKIDKQSKIYRRLKELGVSDGAEIVCKNIAIHKSPIAYKVCSSKLAIRKNDADKVEVEPV